MKPKFSLSFVFFLLAAQVLFAATPVISSFSPASGAVGTLVTITGTGLGSPTDFSIGGKPAIVISNTGTQMVGMVMPGAVTGGLSITTSAGTATASGNFTVTPTMYPDKQQGTKLVGTGNIAAYPHQGNSVAISADGGTAVVGGPTDDPVGTGANGAAWVYIRSGSTWQQQAKLVGTGITGHAYQGISCSISADGNTIALGGPLYNNNKGAVWVFVRTGDTWAQEGNKLVGTGGSANAAQGSAVSLSADGNTLAIGGYYNNSQKGAVWIFVRSIGAWTQQGSKLLPNDGDGKSEFGGAVDLSADGNTLVAGGQLDAETNDPFGQGATWVFTRTGTIWSQQGGKLVGTGGSSEANQGTAVAISADGNTIITGGPSITYQADGAAWVFIRNGNTWAQQGSKLVGSGQEGEAFFGSSVTLSADGNTAVIGAYHDNNSVGAVTVFTRASNSWTQRGSKLVGTGGAGSPLNHGKAVAISADGTTMIEGGSGDQPLGAAWVFTFQDIHPPVITSFTPSSGGVGALVTVTGNNLNNPTAFSIGGKPAVIISNTGTQLVGMVMPGATTGPVSITNADGTAAGSGNFTASPTLYPNTQQGAKLVGSGSIGAASQGFSVAVSADGNTAVVGANTDNSGQGAAWIYVQSGGNWVQQGSKLVGTGNSGAARQGSSVAISADGNTVAIGGIADHGNIGAAWIFTRTTGIWAQQGSKLVGTGNVGASKQGLVSLSADGNTLAVGGSGDDELNGAVWMFTRGGSTWTQQGAKLVGTGFSFNAEQGKVALSADGNTAIVGGFMDGGDNSNNHGAAWIFVRNTGVWSQQGDRLIGTGGSVDAAQGSSVAISADGNTAIVGGYNDKNNIAGSGFVGAAWVFTRSGATWTQQGSKLAGTGAAGEAGQGWSVALSADGNVAMIGGKSDNTNQGAVWVFKRSGSTWAPQGIKQVGTGSIGSAQQGSSLAMSADGSVAIEGGPNDNSNQGAVWAFNYVTPPPLPSISSLSVLSGRVGTLVTITGTNLSNPIAFSIGGVTAVVVSNTGTKVVGMVMPGATTGKITLVTTGGTANSASDFTVTPTLYSYFQQGSKLSGSGNIGHAAQGFSSAVSADGSTAIVGGYNDNNGQGAAWIYIRSGSTWTQQGKLVGTGGAGASQQGFSVSISADGNTAIIGGNHDNSQQGAAWIFTRNGSTWTQGAKLVGSGGSADAAQGSSVSLSADGNTAVVGGSGDNSLQGALWVYTRSNGVWSQQGSKLIGTSNTGASAMGTSVAISANGAAIVTGGEADNNFKGAIWIFTQVNGTWGQQGNKLVGLASSVQAHQGSSVAISADGSTVVEGGIQDNNFQGAIWVFGKNGNTWTQQGAKLVGTGNAGQAYQGSAVAISADGSTITGSGAHDNGNIGAVWTFNLNGSNWLQQGTKLVGSGVTGNSQQGSSVALSADGGTIIEGGTGDNLGDGAIWVFTATPPAAPVISSFSPASGEVGTLVTVTGSNLLNLTGFSIGGIQAIVVSNTDNEVVGLVMPGASSGKVSITATGGTATSTGSFTVTHNVPHPYSQVGTKLPGTGPSDSFFAYALAISADGKTAAVSVPNDNNAQGGILIFTKSENSWTQQGNKLIGNAAPVNAEQGFALSISADGNTLLAGSLGGSVWVFTRNGTVWVQQGPKLIGTGGIGADISFGNAVSLSADGNTALIGGLQDNDYQGAAWIFKRTGATWVQAGSKLSGSGIIGNAAFGTSVALSADGNTAVVGGPYDNGRQGAVWVFTNNGGLWTQLGAKLVGAGSVGPFIYQGNAVALSADGITLVEGGYEDNQSQGAVWVFTRSGSTFLQQGAKLVGTGGVETVRQGSFIRVTADGNTIVEGAPDDNIGLGALWAFTRNGNTWTQLGSKFKGTGNIGNSLQGSAVALTADGGTMIEGGYSDNNRAGALWTFTNQADPPTIASFDKPTGPVGTLVSITGTNLDNPTAFTIGGVPAIVISNSGSQLVGMVMPGATTGAISVSTLGGTVTSSGSFTTMPGLSPKAQMGTKLAATSNIQQGWSVALSADGTTAVVGIRNDDNGKGGALIFTRSGNAWTQQGSKLVGTGAVGNAGQGVSVAISADGNTALIGGNGDNNGQGAAWVFTRNGGVWAQQGAKLVGTGGTATASQGEAVALSADGNTAVLGGPGEYYSRGAVWVFNRYGNNWLQYGDKLVATGNTSFASLGNSVGISANGNTIIAGGEGDNLDQGAAWIFTQNGGPWSQQGSKLVGTGGFGKTYQGLSVAINADGNTAIIGGTDAVWIFTRSGITWSQQGPKLTGSGNVNTAHQGWSVALSADGNTAYEGGYSDNSQLGATWVFKRSSGVWAQQGPKLVGTGAIGSTPNQGRAVALSADGSTAMEGGFGDNGGFGAVWTFIPGKYSQTITFTPFKPVTYGVADFAIPATSLTNAIPIIYSSSDTTVAKIVNNNIHVVAGGTADITASQAGDADYDAATPVSQTLTVNKAPLTITAKNTIGLINHQLPVLTVRYNGFINGDADSSLTSLPVTATTATASSPTGDYPITVSGAISAKYSFTYVPGTLTLSTTTAVTVITSFNPIIGSPGRLVTVIGSHLDNLTGFTIGGVPAIVVSNSGTRLVGMVMPGAATGGVSVTTATGTSAGPGVYTVIPTPHPSGQQGNKLIANGSVGQSSFGASVDVDAEGSTAVIGAPDDNGLQGAVYIFTRTGTLWTQQARLVGTGSIGTARQGTSVAISADGNTIIEGGQYDNNSQGAAWVFTNNNGTWTQQGGKLTGNGGVGQPNQGHAVGLSADGNTAVISGHSDSNSEGAIWVFTRGGVTWTQQGGKLVGTGNIQAANQGVSVTISADGNTIAEGGVGDNSGNGAVWIFIRSGSTWVQQEGKLVGTGNTGAAAQGSSVALSADGNILLSGGATDGKQWGATWAFQRSGTAWLQRGNKFQGTGGESQPHQGTSVALSADGVASIIGGPHDFIAGAVWVYRANGNLWAQQFSKKVGYDYVGNAAEGASVCLSANGKIALVGGPADNSNQGTVWVYSAVNTPAPEITSFSPASGPAGTLVTITGKNLGTAHTARIGVVSADIISKTDSLVVVKVKPGSETAPIFLWTNGGVVSPDSNFTITYPSFQTINLAPLAEAIYGGADVMPNTISTNTSLPIAYSSSNNKVATIVNNKIHITGAGNTTITASQGETVTATRPFTVNKALLTIAADNQTKTLAVKNSLLKQAGQQKLTVKYSGFVNNDNEEKLTAGPVVTTPADDGLPAGTYPITVSGAEADNYTFNYISGILTVNASGDLLTDITKRIVPYPNSFQTVIKLNLGDDNIRDVSVRITAVSNGRLIYSKNYADQAGVLAIDASNFNDGVYALKLTCNQWQRIYKIWKK
jgi:hypothetical protein